MNHLCWAIEPINPQICEKKNLKEPLSPTRIKRKCPLRSYLITCCTRYCVCVCRKVSQWPVQRNITLTLSLHYPGANFTAVKITISVLWPGPPDTQHIHTHLSQTSSEKSLYKQCHSLYGLPCHVWLGCTALSLAPLQEVAKKCYIFKVNRASQPI